MMMMMNNVMPHLIQVNHINTYTVVMTCVVILHILLTITSSRQLDIFYAMGAVATTGTRA